MDKKTEQLNGRITPEEKRNILEFCESHGINESEFVHMAVRHFFEDYNQRGPIRMLLNHLGA